MGKRSRFSTECGGKEVIQTGKHEAWEFESSGRGIYAALLPENKPDPSGQLLEGESSVSIAADPNSSPEVAAPLGAHSPVSATTATVSWLGQRKTTFTQVP